MRKWPRELAASNRMQRTKGAWEMAAGMDCGGGPIQGRGALVVTLGWLLAEHQPWIWNFLFPPLPRKGIVKGVRSLTKERNTKSARD